MINEKKLIKELQKEIDGVIVKDTYSKGKNAGLRKAIILTEEQDQIADRWIPCSDQLPENDKYILLSFENFSVPLVGRYEGDKEGGAFYVGDDAESCGSQGIIVNAWMQLPEQYREED